MAEVRPAGMKILEFFAENPLGEEILEGTMGGAMVGASQLGTDKSPGQVALETATAILGGIGVGMAGRRIGAWAGKKMHAAPLKDQSGMLAFMGRSFGNETTAKGLKENAIMGREAIKEALINDTSATMAREAATDPAAFLGKYGVDPVVFQANLGAVQGGRVAAAGLRAMELMPPEQRQMLMRELQKKLGDYEAVENAVTGATRDSFDQAVKGVVADREKIGAEVDQMAREVGAGGGGVGDYVSRMLSGLDRPVQQITGEHVGKAVGRFLGDEVGVLGGMAAGSLLAQQLGMESPKDRRIRELEKQLAGRG